MKKQKGFTLAEVLITLTIIGVIAALTIPTLIGKYQKHTYVVGLKKAYSDLSNAIKMIPMAENCHAGDLECAGFFQNTEEATDIDGQRFEGDSWVKAAYLVSKQIQAQSFCNGKYSTQQSNCYRPLSSGHGNSTNENSIYHVLIYHPKAGFIDKSGRIWVFRIASNMDRDYNNFVLVDINGKKGPNLDGRDTFKFTIAPTEKNGIKVGTVIPDGSKLWNKYVYDGAQYATTWCNPPAKAISTNCTGRVLEENAMNY